MAPVPQLSTSPTVPGASLARPLVVANYFLSFTGVENELGRPIVFLPSDLAHDSGRWHDAGVRDYWIADSGTEGFLSRGPDLDLETLKSRLQALNNRGWDRLSFRIDYELMALEIAFSAQPLGHVDVTATGVDGTSRTLYRHDVHPQDFDRPGVFRRFSFDMADYVPAADEVLAFRVYWNGGGALAVGGIGLTPLEFISIFGGWGNVPWNGGLDPGTAYRVFDPHWILTGRFGKDGSLRALERIDWWRRDIMVGHNGLYPYIGPYDQRRPELLRYQIRQAKAAGIDAFKVYTYYGTGAQDTDIATWHWSWASFEQMLDIAAAEGFGIFVDDSGLEQVASTPYSYEDAVANLGFVARRGFLDHPGYLKIDGRPLYGLPLTNETEPQRIVDFVSAMNRQYHTQTGNSAALYALVTALTTWGTPNPTGPYNLQEWYFDTSYHTWKNWEEYFTCSPPAVDLNDLLARGRLRYAPAEPVSGYGVFLATLLQRDSMAAFRNLPGVTALFDWCAVGAMLYPQYIYPEDGTYHLGGRPDRTTTAKAFAAYVDDAHRFRYKAVVSISPGHDKSNVWRNVSYELNPRREADGRTLRWRRMVSSALAASPDIIDIENWNGYGESVHIEPCEGFTDEAGRSDPDIFLKILAQELGSNYKAPGIPPSAVDPIKRPTIPNAMYEMPQPP